MNLLHIDSSILGPNSVSRQLSADIVARIAAANPGAAIVRRDLAADPLPHLSGAHLSPDAAQADPAVAGEVAQSAAVLGEFLAADTVVIGVAFYNFTIPSQLKAWIDRVLISGKTFRYGADGTPEGLAGDKRVIQAIARGGFYGEGAPSAAFEHAESYLRAAFAFIGVTDLEVINADGLAAGPDHRAAGIAAANEQVERLAAA